MKNPVPHLLFVYGSLRSDFGSSAHAYITRYFTLVAKAKVQGRLYDLGPYPAAIPADDEVYIVGELYEITDPRSLSPALNELDDYEGIAGEGTASLYRRERVEVFKEGGPVKAWIYWYNGDLSGKPMVPAGDIVEYRKAKKK